MRNRQSFSLLLRRCRCIEKTRCCQASTSAYRPELDFDYLLDKTNINEIRCNVQKRKQRGDIDGLHRVWSQLQSLIFQGTAKLLSESEYANKWNELCDLASEIPNRTHPDVPNGDEPVCVNDSRIIGEMLEPDKPVHRAEQLLTSWKTLRQRDLRHSAGDRAYSFVGPAARMERALLDYGRDTVLGMDRGFIPIIVPDRIERAVVRDCGLMDRDSQGLVYAIESDPNQCLSGTGEMGVACYIQGQTYTYEQLPLKFLTISRCFRPEAFGRGKELGIYRVHEFTKAEMFIVTADETGKESEAALNELVSIQTELYSQLGLHFKIQDMPSHELGAPAYRKYDCECWLPGRQQWGELSSASNCLDYQARRLDVKYVRPNEGNETRHVHTCNGTAIAATRLCIAVIETSQLKRGRLEFPSVLHKYLKEYETEDETKWSVATVNPTTEFEWCDTQINSVDAVEMLTQKL